ncbi:M28 family metallopeptidase [candidate division KSB1 bacterium]
MKYNVFFKRAVSYFVVILLFLNCTASTDTVSSDEIMALQKDVLSRLTGNSEILPGLTISERFTPENKMASLDYLGQVFKDIGLVPQRHQYSGTGTNMFAILNSTNSSTEYVLLGAHFDSISDCPGANDNASGVALVLGVAKYLVKTEIRSKNIIFVLFDEEERGLRGSKSFAQKLADERVNVTSVHTVDQMGWDSDGDMAFELEIPYEGAVELYERAVIAAGKDVTIHQTKVPSTDHTSFREIGYNAVGLTEEYRNRDTTPHYHKSTDSFETINFEYLLSSTVITIEAFKELIK